jgi:hypothetical protein
MTYKSVIAIAVLTLSCALAHAQDNEQKFTLPHISVTGSSFEGPLYRPFDG